MGVSYYCCDFYNKYVVNPYSKIGGSGYYDYTLVYQGYFTSFRMSLWSLGMSNYDSTYKVNIADEGAYFLPCQDGYYVVGFHGWGGDGADDIRAVCAPLYLPCPVGFYSQFPDTGAVACPASTFNPNTGQSTVAACIGCPTGAYNPNLGQAACTPCPVNSYTSSTSRISSATCSTGSYSNPGSTTCQQPINACAAGFQNNPNYDVTSVWSPSYTAYCQVGQYVCGINFQGLHSYFFYCCNNAGGQTGYYRITSNNFGGGLIREALWFGDPTGYPVAPFTAGNTINVFQNRIERLESSYYGAKVYSGNFIYNTGSTPTYGADMYTDSVCEAGKVATGLVGYWDSNIDYKFLMCNALCVACSTGTIYSSSSNAATCTACILCGSGKKMVSQCTISLDRTCIACSSETYSTLADNQATTCTACTTCNAGTRVNAACTTTSDRTCTACTAGTNFANTTNQATCAACSTCAAGTRVNAPCTTTSDRTCTACTLGTNFANTTNQTTCTSCNTCLAGTRVNAACTTTSDRTCTACTAGTNFANTTNQTTCTSLEAAVHVLLAQG
jgi:hypothetical protein